MYMYIIKYLRHISNTTACTYTHSPARPHSTHPTASELQLDVSTDVAQSNRLKSSSVLHSPIVTERLAIEDLDKLYTGKDISQNLHVYFSRLLKRVMVYRAEF